MVIEDTAASIWPDCTAANRPWNGMLTISTLLPSRFPISLTRSTSKPTNLPEASWNSHGTLPILAPTLRSAAQAVPPPAAIKIATAPPSTPRRPRASSPMSFFPDLGRPPWPRRNRSSRSPAGRRATIGPNAAAGSRPGLVGGASFVSSAARPRLACARPVGEWHELIRSVWAGGGASRRRGDPVAASRRRPVRAGHRHGPVDPDRQAARHPDLEDAYRQRLGAGADPGPGKRAKGQHVRGRPPPTPLEPRCAA